MIAFVYYTEIYSVTKCLCHVMLWLKELELKIKLGRVYLKNMFRKKIKKIKEFVISPHEWGATVRGTVVWTRVDFLVIRVHTAGMLIAIYILGLLA